MSKITLFSRNHNAIKRVWNKSKLNHGSKYLATKNIVLTVERLHPRSKNSLFAEVRYFWIKQTYWIKQYDWG